MQDLIKYIHTRIRQIRKNPNYQILYRVLTIQPNAQIELKYANQILFIQEISDFLCVESQMGKYCLIDDQQKNHQIEHKGIITLKNYGTDTAVLKYFEVSIL